MNIREEIRAAREGDIVAQEKIAWRYHIGDGVRKSEKKSFFWSYIAAQTGMSPISSFNVSISYFNGEGVKQDDSKAFYWAKQAAKQGLADGYFACGIHWLYGYGVKRNIKKAKKALEKSYEMAKFSQAAEKLAFIYLNGVGIKKSNIKKFMWTSRAAVSNDNPIIFYNLGLFYLKGIGISRNLQKAFLWTKKSAIYNDRDGMLAVGWHYLNGIGVKKNIESAKYWFEKCIVDFPKESKAYYNLGGLFLFEYNNQAKAFELFSKAYQIDRHVAAAYELAKLYLKSNFMPQDIHRAKILLRYSSKRGFYLAKRLLLSKRINSK